MVDFISNYFNRLNWDAFFTSFLEKSFSLLLLFVVFFIAKKVLKFFAKKFLKPTTRLNSQDINRQKTVARLFENFLTYVLYFFIIYGVLSILGLPLGSLLAGAGIAGVAIGLGAQSFLTDVINGFFIMFERQMDVGDTVTVTNGPITITGKVVIVGLRTCQIKGEDGTMHYVPNRNIMAVSNQSRGDMRVQIDLPLPTTVDLSKVYAAIDVVHSRELRNYPAVTKLPILLGSQTDVEGNYTFRIQLFVTSGQQTVIYETFYKLYQEALQSEGIALVKPILSE